MSDEKHTKTEDATIEGRLWRFESTWQSEGWTNFRAWRHSGERENGEAIFGTMQDLTTDHTQVEPDFKGYVKFDGCVEIELLDAHCCGVKDLRSLTEAMLWCHRLCLRMPYVDACADYTAEEVAAAKEDPR